MPDTATPEEPTVDATPPSPTYPSAPPAAADVASPAYPSAPPAAATPAAPSPTRVATAALVLGIIAIVFAVIPVMSFVAFVPAIIAVILGIVSIVRAMPARGRAIAGLILGGVAFFVAISTSANFVNGTSNSQTASDTSAQSDSGQSAAKPSPIKTADPAQAAKSWADKKYGKFAPTNATGTSDNLVTLPAGATAGIVTATYTGSGNFSISVLDANNKSTGELLVNTIGAYAGTTGYGFTAFGKGVSLQVSADAAWTITVSPVSAAPILAASGTGDGVFLFGGPVGQSTASYNGSSNFVIEQQTGAGFSDPLLVNTIGAYAGTVPISAGPSVFMIEADGAWTAVAK
ncbi:MAG TPA: DUF4190 domain-containing protein [Galbitalea sp.]|nr:DUF4190 domain-containing protein [Galbitalea sp.]